MSSKADERAKAVLAAIEATPPDTFCGIAKKPAWNIVNAAKMLGKCVQTVRNWVNSAKKGRGNIPFYQATKNSEIFFPIRELVDWDMKKGEH